MMIYNSSTWFSNKVVTNKLGVIQKKTFQEGFEHLLSEENPKRSTLYPHKFQPLIPTDRNLSKKTPGTCL